jgi:tight junction protein 1
MSSKKLLEQCQKLEKLWSHVFTATMTMANITAENQWYNKLTDLIDKQQTAPIWISETKVLTSLNFLNSRGLFFLQHHTLGVLINI